MQYFIAPRSGEKSYKNYKSTIVHGVPYENIEPHLTSEGLRLLLAEDVIYSWGNRPGTKSQWESMEYGDKVIFYAKGELVLIGEVYFKQQSPDLSLAMWPPDDNGNPWEYTFFLRNLQYIKMPMRAFNWAAGYKDNFVVQGFIPLKPDRVKKIAEEHGSVEQLLGIFSTTVSEEIPAAHEKMYVNVAEDVSPVVASADMLSPLVRKGETDESTLKHNGPKKIDYLEKSKNNAVTGGKGEALVLKYERDALINAARPDLAAMVERVSDTDDTLGYDILSYTLDGEKKYIEVKTTSQKSQNVRFFMSANEMKKSNELLNYYIYFVDLINTKRPRITPIECPFIGQLSITTHTFLLEAERLKPNDGDQK